MLLCFFLSRKGAVSCVFFFFQAEDGIRDLYVTGVQTCALPISKAPDTPRWTTRGILIDCQRRRFGLRRSNSVGSRSTRRPPLRESVPARPTKSKRAVSDPWAPPQFLDSVSLGAGAAAGNWSFGPKECSWPRGLISLLGKRFSRPRKKGRPLSLILESPVP